LEQEKNNFNLNLKGKFLTFGELTKGLDLYDNTINAEKSDVFYFEEICPVSNKFNFMKVFDITNNTKITFLISDFQLELIMNNI